MISLFSSIAGLSCGRMSGSYFVVLGLDVPEVVPRRSHQLGLHQQIDHRHRLHLGAGGDALVRDRRRHRDGVRPVVARAGPGMFDG